MIRFSLDPASVRETKRIIREYEQKVGQSAADSVIDIGREGARQAAQKCPPFGLSENIGNRFKLSIAKQIQRAVTNANVTGRQGSASQVHQAARNRKGQVHRELETEGQFKRAPIPIRDKERLIDQKQAAAGIVKGAWIHAGTLLGRKAESVIGRKRVPIGQWIMRHLKRGKATVSKMGINTEVTLTNTVAWASNLQSESMLNSAVNAAFRARKREMQKRIENL